MALRASSVVGVCFVLIFACGILHGQSTPQRKAKPMSVSLTDDEVETLIKQMGGTKVVDRNAAIEKLRAAGVDVIPELSKAASEGNRQASNNALAILKSHVAGDHAETRIAAYQALRRLSSGSKPAVAAAAKKIMEDHKEVRVEADAAKVAARSNRPSRNDKKASTRPMASAASDPATQMRRESLEQSLKDAEKAIQEIKKLKLPKDLEAQQISAITQSMQNLREQLKKLDAPRRNK